MEKSTGVVIGLLLLAVAILSLFVAGIWYLNFFGFSLLSKGVLLVIGMLLSLLFLLLVFGIIGIFLTMKTGQPYKVLFFPTKIVISYVLPVLIEIAGILGFDKEKIQSSFIGVSNQLIDPNQIKVQGDDILLLVPHCIQLADCQYRVTSDINNCKKCGRCQVQDLIALKEKYGIHLAIATGGTLARKIIKETRPKAIIAVACERDLSSGIQDIYPLPVIGVVNLRPNGPCFNTGVNIDEIEEAIEKLIN